MSNYADTAAATKPAKRSRGRPKGAKTKPRPPETLPVVKPVAMRFDTASAYTGLSKSTLVKLAAAGRIKTTSVGRAKLLIVKSLDQLVGIDG
jgi:excisionase family DNA binding protein